MGRIALVALVLAGCKYTAPTPGSDDPNNPIDGASPTDTSPPTDTNPPADAPMSSSTTDHVAVADVYLNSLQPNSSMAGDAFVIVDSNPDGVGLFAFDLAAIAANASVSAAELHIRTANDPGATVQISLLLEAWTENGATFDQRASGVPWTSVGATPPGSRSAASIGSFTPNTTNTEYVVPLDTAAITGWISNPATNFGIAIHTVNTDGPRFVSREGTTAHRPFLRITHVP